ncbi:MAG TPA: type II toxin-antitoxin system HicA family toxin [Thermodesulfobacteriota bacterium]|nr:type II toxin-antitoxin system HicA family toxin [Thermodesulfobacteriota bacterium]
MSIDYSKLRNITAREIISALIKDGFVFDRQSGSHQHYRHPDGRRVTVTLHRPGQTFPVKTLKAMIEYQAGWTKADLKRLKLI